MAICSSGLAPAWIGPWTESGFTSVPCRCPVADCVSWALPLIGLVFFSCLAGDELAVSSSRPVSCDGNLGSDFLWGFFAEFDGLGFFTPFWETFSSRLRLAGWSDVVFSSVSGVDLFLERPSFGDLALVGGIYSNTSIRWVILPCQSWNTDN